MPDVMIDSTTLAAVVSAIVAFIMLYLDKYFIEPRKWQRRYEIRSLEKALEVHGWLISVLKACREKSKRHQEKGSPIPSHLLESADIIKLEDIFEKRAYLLSDKMKQTWYDLQKKDTYFEMMRVRYRDTDQPPQIPTEMGVMQFPARKHEVISSDLTEMQNQAELDFSQLQERYRKLTGFKSR